MGDEKKSGYIDTYVGNNYGFGGNKFNGTFNVNLPGSFSEPNGSTAPPPNPPQPPPDSDIDTYVGNNYGFGGNRFGGKYDINIGGGQPPPKPDKSNLQPQPYRSNQQPLPQPQPYMPNPQPAPQPQPYMPNSQPAPQFLTTTQGYRALLYNGDHDMCMPYTGNEAWTRAMGHRSVDERRSSWISNEQVAGYTRGYDHGLTFLTIKRAGHTVPEYKSREALNFYTRWL